MQPACSGHLRPSCPPAGPAPPAVHTPGCAPSTHVSPRGQVTRSQLHFLVRPGSHIPPALSKLWPGRWRWGCRWGCRASHLDTQRGGAGLAPWKPSATAARGVASDDAGAAGCDSAETALTLPDPASHWSWDLSPSPSQGQLAHLHTWGLAPGGRCGASERGLLGERRTGRCGRRRLQDQGAPGEARCSAGTGAVCPSATPRAAGLGWVTAGGPAALL